MKGTVALLALAIVSADLPRPGSFGCRRGGRIARGKTTTSKKLLVKIKKRNQFRVNRAGLDPIEKKVTFLSDGDRIALESAEATREMRELSVADVRKNMRFGVTEVLLEASCYTQTVRVKQSSNCLIPGEKLSLP